MSSPDPRAHPIRSGWVALSCTLGAAAVVLGALGAHGPLADLLKTNGNADIWKTAVLYHLVHSAVLLVWVFRPFPQGGTIASWFLLFGTIAFSGSLYLLATTDAKWLGPVTPLGGVSLIAGWLGMGMSALAHRNAFTDKG